MSPRRRRPWGGCGARGSAAFGARPAPERVRDFPPKNVRVNDPAADTGGSTGQNCPTLSVNGADVVVAFNNPQLLPATAAGFARSDDGGASFVDLGGLPGSQFGNPVLADDGAGNLYFATILRQGGLITSPPPFSSIGVSRSTDGGVTFTPPVDVLDDTTAVARVQDVGWVAVDPTTGNLYLTWSEVSASVPGGDLDRVQIRFSRSDDHGATWSSPLALSPATPTGQWGATPAVAPDGTLYVSWIQFLPQSPPIGIYISRSDDEGRTFSNPVASGGAVAAVPEVYIGSTGFDEGWGLTAPAIAVGPGGTVFLVYPASDSTDGESFTDGGDIFLIRSADRGETWGDPLRVNDDATRNDQWQPSVAVAANGTVGVMFYDCRNDPANADRDVYLAVSHDDGLSFLPNRRVTDVSSPPAGSPRPDPPYRVGFIYNQIVARGNHFYMVWADNRDTVAALHTPDIYFAQQDACQAFSDAANATDAWIAELDDALASGLILAQDAPRIRRLIQSLTLQLGREEAALADCRAVTG